MAPCGQAPWQAPQRVHRSDATTSSMLDGECDGSVFELARLGRDITTLHQEADALGGFLPHPPDT